MGCELVGVKCLLISLFNAIQLVQIGVNWDHLIVGFVMIGKKVNLCGGKGIGH